MRRDHLTMTQRGLEQVGEEERGAPLIMTRNELEKIEKIGKYKEMERRAECNFLYRLMKNGAR